LGFIGFYLNFIGFYLNFIGFYLNFSFNLIEDKFFTFFTFFLLMFRLNGP